MDAKEFQFPTGWNSTIGTNLNSLADVGFNSQRDGILLLFFVPGSFKERGFNSQRDGILLKFFFGGLR